MITVGKFVGWLMSLSGGIAMPKGRDTSVFVSSTCYDLSQVREDLREFLLSLGLDPVLSDFDSFPVIPNQGNVENCLNAVRERADIFVLIVGGRYGSINETGRSITNLEFSEASMKGVPKYVFVSDKILSLLPVWKANKDGDFSSAVDTPQLFEFVSELRESGETWVYPFSSAKDITNTLRKQFSYLWADALALRTKIYKSNIDSYKFGPNALRIYVEKPIGWEFLLFARLLSDRVESHRDKRYDVDLEIGLGPVILLNDAEQVMSWVQKKFSWIMGTVASLTKAIDSGFIKAMGPPGTPSDIPRMIHLADRIAGAYEQLLDWTLEFHRVHADERYNRILSLTRQASTNSIGEIEDFSKDLYRRFSEALAGASSGTKVDLIVSLTLTTCDMAELMDEMGRVAATEI